MRRLEDELRDALRRREPPSGFASRVLARIGAGKQAGNSLRSFVGTPAFRWLAGSLAGVILVVGLAFHQEQARRAAEAERDSRQALLALRITGQKLNEAFARVAGAGRHVPGDPAKFDLSQEEP